MWRSRASGAVGAFCILALGSQAVRADVPPPPAVQRVKITEHLGQPIPEDLTFTDSSGAPFQVKKLLHQGKPVIVTLVYYDCPMLCTLILHGLAKGLRGTGLKLGRDYGIETISFNPAERSALAAKKKREYTKLLDVPSDDPAWIFGTGEKPAITKLADAFGYGYVYDPKSKTFAHDAVIMVVSPEGRIMRYLYGINYKSQDLKFALIQASHGKVGTALDRVLLTCFRYDPASRTYTPVALEFVKIGSALVLLSLSTLIFILWRADVKKRKRGASA